MSSLPYRSWALAVALAVLASGIALVAHAEPIEPSPLPGRPCWEGSKLKCLGGSNSSASSSTSGSATSTTSSWSSDTSTPRSSTSSKSSSPTSTTPAISIPNVSYYPSSSETVGIAQPIVMTFGRAMEPAEYGRLEKEISVSTANGAVAGRVAWLRGAADEKGKVSTTVARWRPDRYWPPNTTVTVKVGESKHTVKIGGETTTYVNNDTHTLTVFKDGKEVKSFPISMGKPGFETNNGRYYIGERARTKHMEPSDTPKSSPEWYSIDAEWATQFATKGFYVHAAPWSVDDQGKRNVSHGCVNATTENAKWFQENVKAGDPLIVENVKDKNGKLVPPIDPDQDGLGDWNREPKF